MIDATLTENVQRLIEEILVGTELELVDLRIRRQGRNIVIEALVDRRRGGITLDECAAVNRKIGDLIDARNLIVESYIIEVNSPGIDRPLKTEKDFLRNLGRRVRVYLSESVGSKMEYEAVVREVLPNRIILEQGENHLEIPLEKIHKGVQSF
jgi:ribosome maturation factor RimP